MAHKEMVPSGEVRSWLGASMFWNVSNNVGYGYPNKKADVLLVQYLLNSVARIKKEPDTLIVPDGRFGGKTWARIKQIQTDECRTGVSIPDGMVSAIDGSRLYGPKQGGMYTIILLNTYLVRWLSHYFPDIRRDPKCPNELVQILKGPMPDLI